VHEAAGGLHHGKSAQRHPLYRRHLELGATRLSAPGSIRPGFTSRYGCKMLVWYEIFDEMLPAIAREKQIKDGSRKKKLALIEALNPDWRDLYEDLL
jgi:hypothetical protein